MKLREIFRYELQHRLRTPSTWIYAVVLLLMAFGMIHVDADGQSATHVNSPMRLALLGTMLGMVGLLVSAAFFADAGIRDHESRMDPLLFTSPIRKLDYLGGRFLGAFVMNALLLLVIPIGHAVGTLMPYLPAPSFGPFMPGAFIQTYLLFLLPNLILTSAILFTVAVLTRQAVPVYLAAIGVFIGYVAAVNVPAGTPLSDLLTDPLGIRMMNQITERWTPIERNSRLLGSSGALLMNRTVWVLIGCAVLALLQRRFRFAHPTDADVGGRVKRRLFASAPLEPTLAPATNVRVPRVAGVTGLRTTFRQLMAVVRRLFSELTASPVFLLLFVGKIGITILMGWEAGETVFDTSSTPVTILIFERLADTPLVAITYLLVAVYAGEVIWKDREHDMGEIADAAPVSEGVTLSGGFLALVAVLAILQLPVMIGGMIAQVAQGYTNFEIGLYLRILFGLQMADLVALAALAILVHVLVNQKYLAHLVVVLVLIGRVVVRQADWIEHHLLIYGTDPGWKYSAMNGFGPFLRGVLWFKLYWAAWAAVLLIAAVLFLVRGRETGLRKRIALARERFAGSVTRATAAAGIAVVSVGGFIFYNTNVLNHYVGGKQQGSAEAEYEKRYRRYLDIPQPTIVAADLRVEMHPAESAAELRGTFRLVNRTSASIDSVHLVITRGLEVRALSVDRGSKRVIADSVVGYHVLALDRALAPGDSANLTFDFADHRGGFANDAPPTAIAGNGTWLDRRYLPFVGYQPVFELGGGDRENFKLPAKKPTPPAATPGDDRNRQPLRGDADHVKVHAIIGTSEDQIGVTPGLLRRAWTENGRHYFEYETNPPTSVAGGFFSARYKIRDDRWNDVALRVLHDPREGENVERMMHGMKASLGYYTAQFGPYPDSLLQVIEIPRYSVFGVALPTSMAFSEDAFHSNVREGQIDQPFYGTAHETAHHWWGGMVQPAPVKGHGLLSESLANYSAIMVMEKTFGLDVARRVYHFQMDRYFRGRGEFSREAALVDVEDQSYLTYRKGAVAMYTMRHAIGEDAVNSALRRYVAKFNHDGPPYPTSLDLLTELRAVTPDSLQPLVKDLFETITLWEVKADSAKAERTADGKYAVTLEVRGRKVRSDNVGRETEIPMDDLVEIGVFGAGTEAGLGTPLYLERHRIRSGRQTIRVIVSQPPKRAAIDPYDMLIDRERGDNIRDVVMR